MRRNANTHGAGRVEGLEQRLMLDAAASADDQYVSGLFNNLLNRAPQPSETNLYATQLAGVTATRVPVALEIINTPGFAAAEVQNAYTSLLRRAPDPESVAFFSDAMAAGASLADLDAALTASPEYFQTQGGGTNAGFLTAIYRDALARAPDDAGKASWEAALASGVSRYQVAQFIFHSSEFEADWIQGLYGFFEHRAATAAELASSLATLKYEGEKMTLAQIVASPSAYGVLSNHANGNYVTELYRDLLGREPDALSLSAWENGLNSGVLQPSQLVRDILSSPEYDGDVVTGIYNQYLNRAPDPGGLAFFSGILASGGAPEQVAIDVGTSAEFMQLHTSGTTQSFLESFYQDTFGAPFSSADPALSALLNVPASPSLLARLVLASPAYRNFLVAWKAPPTA